MALHMLDYLRSELHVSHLQRRGSGGFGEVYSGMKDGVVDAFKISLEPLKEKERRRAAQELELLNHPAVRGCQQIVQLLGVHWKDGHLISRWQLGEQSVADRLQACEDEGRAGLPPNELRRYLLDAARAIDLVNGLGFRHRDIKPDNLVVFRDEVGERVVRVADFGLVLYTGASTRSNTGAGTLGYADPDAEIGERGKVSRTVDIYALAATAIKLATGHGPFGETQFKIVEAQRASRPVTTGLTASQTEAVLAALHLNPAQRRFKTATEFVNAFLDERVVGRSPRTSSSQAPPKQHKQPSKSLASRLWSLLAKPKQRAAPRDTEDEFLPVLSAATPKRSAVPGDDSIRATVLTLIYVCQPNVINAKYISAIRAMAASLQHRRDSDIGPLVIAAEGVTPKTLSALAEVAKRYASRLKTDYYKRSKYARGHLETLKLYDPSL